MSNRNNLKTRVKKLLEFKSKNYKKKFYLLSRLSESRIQRNNKCLEEFKCLARTLNKTNGEIPSEQYIFEFLKNNTDRNSLSSIKESYYLNYSDSVKSVKDIVLEEINKIEYKNSKLDKKLEETLVRAVSDGINIFESNGSKKMPYFILDDVVPTKEELSAIESEPEDDGFGMEDESPQESGKTLDKIAQIFAPVTGKDPRKISKKELALMLGYTGLGKYEPTAKTYKLSGWEKLERDIVRRMNPYVNTGISVVAKRKWWIIKSIEACLMLEKQANKAFGTPEDVKAKFNVEDPEQMAAVQTISRSRRSSGGSLSDAEGRIIMDQLHQELTKGNYDLENTSISEKRLLSLLADASRFRGGTAKQFAADLEIMYPLSDQRADFEKVPMQSDKERQDTQDEVEDYFRKKEEETREVYGDEIDPETGEPLYADQEQIQQINKQRSEEVKTIEKQEIIQNMSKSNYLNMTSREATEYLDNLSKDLERLGDLHAKTVDKANPEIFSEFRTDPQGNILPDINAIPDVISAEGLTPEEQKEMEELIEKVAAVDVVKMINDSEREQIYQDLVDKSVTVDEFIAYNKKFGLDNPDKPMTYEDIKRASAGSFTGPQGARQYAVKAWIKSVFFNFSPSDKSDIYSFLAERWYDRLKVLDLIDDQAFAIKPDRVDPNDPSKDKAIPRKALDAAEALGKYKRSNKLVDISNMLELVSKYTSPRYVKRYFDEKRDDNLPQAVSEKINQIQTFAETTEEYDALIKRLETEDPDTMAFAIMDSMFNDKSGFRIFATGMLKEYYNNTVWPQTEVALAQAVKEYFKRHHPSAGIARSLGANEGADAVKPDEGKDLFNKLIYIAMERTGIKTSGKGLPNVGDSVEDRKEYLRGNRDSRGDFVKAVAAYNAKYQQGKKPLLGRDGSVFSLDDLEYIIDDIFSSSGIIGKASSDLKRLNATSASEIITWIGSYPEGKLDQAILLGMSLSDFYRREDVNTMLTLPIEEIGKDTAKALSDYKKKYGKSQLMSSDFVEWLDDYLGMEPVDLKSQGVKKPGGKSFQ